MRIFIHIIVSVVVVLTASCALYGPNYKKPAVEVPSKWESVDHYTQVESQVLLSDIAWWQKFNDKSLNDLIKQALDNNANIQQAIGNIIQATGSLQQVQYNWIPTISGQAGYNTIQNLGGGSNNNINGSGSGNQSTGTLSPSGYSAGLIPSYSLNILQQLRTQEASTANLAIQKYAYNAMRLTIISQVVGSYFTLLSQDYLLNLQKQLVDDTLEQLRIARNQYHLGYISLITLQTYEQQYYGAVAQVPVLENNIVQTENAIRVLINKNPGRIRRNNNFETIKVNYTVLSNLPSNVLRNRPDILQAEEQLKQANANIGVATSNYFPTISLTGQLGSATSSLNSLLSASTDYWQTAINANMPFLNLSYLGSIKGAKGAYYTAYYNYILTVESAFAQVDGGLSQHQKILNSYNLQFEQFKSTQVTYLVSKERYHDGADSLVTLLISKINYDNAAIALANVKIQELQSIVNLYQYLAGGYNINNNLTPKKFGDAHDS